MIKYVGKRIMYMILVFFIMSIALFFLYNLIPGDPARAELEPLRNKLTAEEYQYRYQLARERLGLDDPMPIRYAKWMSGVLQGDFGMSSIYKAPVREVIVSPMKITVFINIFSIIITLAITIPLGIFTAVKKNSIFDKSVQVLTIVGYSIPVFIIALLFIYLFAVRLGWFPVSGLNTPNFSGTAWEEFKDTMYHLALPLGVLTVGSLGGLTRYVRAAMIDALSMDYIRTARAKGLKERVVIFSHAWRNALLPVITLIISWLMSVFAGSLVIERMFNLKGMGDFYISALTNQDYNVAMAIQLFYIILALLGNLLSDLSYGVVDPRVRVNK
ncbi:MAG TPA: ABC transporter permease [Soehngenia sp.]|uniref:ABC transporter permease n=1 Tax=Soehngenia longivitae TaxID=2562294 RepID=A0A4Z0D652_9FIRM|nr:ABC transporter permease [Soehngenia longivitae]TFZ40355.1 ABC transporter permease [Soehngenia longivitae]HOK62758.1 ABC transporter permease [Soehngenia sp.]HPP31672.1 ABC transporter permease [Soehngenia sp.]